MKTLRTLFFGFVGLMIFSELMMKYGSKLFEPLYEFTNGDPATLAVLVCIFLIAVIVSIIVSSLRASKRKTETEIMDMKPLSASPRWSP